VVFQVPNLILTSDSLLLLAKMELCSLTR